MNNNPYRFLKSGSDIRGTAVEGVKGEGVELTDKAVFDLTVGFCRWLDNDCGITSGRIAVGHDSRISAERNCKQWTSQTWKCC